jgi:hypothetical protein
MQPTLRSSAVSAADAPAAAPSADGSVGKSYLNLKPDRVAMQDATAQMAVLQVRARDMQPNVFLCN